MNREKVVDHFVGISAMDSALGTHGLAAINLELFSDMVSEISLIYELEATERARLIQFSGPMVDVALLDGGVTLVTRSRRFRRSFQNIRG